MCAVLWQVVKFLFWYLVLKLDFLALLSTSFSPFGLNKNLSKYKIQIQCKLHELTNKLMAYIPLVSVY